MTKVLVFLWAFIAVVPASATVETGPISVQIESKISSPLYDFGAGSQVKLSFADRVGETDALFLGQMMEQDGTVTDDLFLDLQKTRVYLVDTDHVHFDAPVGRMQTILKPMNQWGGSCAAYAITHFWKQLYRVGFHVNPAFTETCDTEEGRTHLLEETIDRYYLDARVTMNSIMNSYGKRFGFRCHRTTFQTGAEASDFVFREASAANPVLIEFDIGPNMVTSTYEVVDYEKPETIDSRLWVPRQVGSRNSGGHAIVVVAGFKAMGRKKAVVLDSDWDEPRIWDIEKYISAKTAMKTMGFYTCE